MALSDAVQTVLAKALAGTIFTSNNATGHSNLDQLKAAVDAIDDGMKATGNQIAALYPTTQLRLALLAEAQSGAANLTIQEAGVALAYWALNEVGLL